MSLVAIAAAARCAPALLQCLHSCTAPPTLLLGWRLGRAVPGWVWRQQRRNPREGRGTVVRGRARRQLTLCPSLPARPGRGVTSSRGVLPGSAGAGALRAPMGAPGENNVGFGNGRKLCQCHAGLTAPAPGVTGGNWAVTSESSHGWGSPRSRVGAFLCAQEAEQEPHLKK